MGTAVTLGLLALGVILLYAGIKGLSPLAVVSHIIGGAASPARPPKGKP